MFTFFKNILFPIQCVRCRAFDTHLCSSCACDILQLHVTQRPNASLQYLYHISSYKSKPIHDFIHHIKYSGITDFGSLFAHSIPQEVLAQYDAIVPIPLHNRRLRERGWNQAELISHALSSVIHQPVVPILTRHTYTVSQTTLSAADRKKNVSGIFSIRKMPDKNIKALLLVDDVWTTGSTITEAAMTLHKQFPVLKISAFVIAKGEI